MGTALYDWRYRTFIHDEVGRWHSLRFCGTSIVTFPFPNGGDADRVPAKKRKTYCISNRARKNGRGQTDQRTQNNKKQRTEGRHRLCNRSKTSTQHKGGRGRKLEVASVGGLAWLWAGWSMATVFSRFSLCYGHSNNTELLFFFTYVWK